MLPFRKQRRRLDSIKVLQFIFNHWITQTFQKACLDTIEKCFGHILTSYFPLFIDNFSSFSGEKFWKQLSLPCCKFHSPKRVFFLFLSQNSVLSGLYSRFWQSCLLNSNTRACLAHEWTGDDVPSFESSIYNF